MTEQPVVTDIKEENKETQEETQDHEHDHDHDHDHDAKGGKSEKKVRKALSKLGMVKMEGVNRVTIRQKDNYILVVKDPEVYSSKEAENSYIIFGEITMDDPDKLKANQEVDNLKAQGETLEKPNEQPQNVEIVPETEEASEEGLDPESIEMVVNETKCTRQKAVKALRSNGGDVVNAILEINN